MATEIVTRASKGGRLTQEEMDANFINLYNAIQQAGGGTSATSPLIPAPSITQADVGKIAMLDASDGQVKVYQNAPAIAGVAGEYDFQIQHVDADDLYFEGYNFQVYVSDWASSPATVDEAATQLKTYLNNTHSDKLTASATGDTVSVVMLAPPSNRNGVYSNGANIAMTTIVQDVVAQPEQPKALQLGVISSVETGGVTLDSGGYIKAIAGADIVRPAFENNIFDWMYGLWIVAGADGKAYPVSSLPNGDLSEENILAIIGFAMNDVEAGGEVIIKTQTALGGR